MAQTPPDFRSIDAILQSATAAGNGAQIPGAVVVIGHDGAVVYRKAFGWRSLAPVREYTTSAIGQGADPALTRSPAPVREPMSVDTVFRCGLAYQVPGDRDSRDAARRKRTRKAQRSGRAIASGVCRQRQAGHYRAPVADALLGIAGGFGSFFSGAVGRQAERLRAWQIGRSRCSPLALGFATPISISLCSAGWSRSSRAWRWTSMRRSIFSSHSP